MMQPFKLERFFAKYEFKAPHLLCCSDCEPMQMSELLTYADADAQSRWQNLRLAYTDTLGLPELRAAIAGLYKGVRPEEVLVCAPEEGIYLSMRTLLQPGDNVVVTYPGYQSLYEIAASMGCTISRWEPCYSPDTGHSFHLEDLKPLVTSSTKLVAVNFPHNPTGATLSAQEYEAMVQVVSSAGAWLFSDEMYKFLEPAPATPLPSAAELTPRGVTLCGVSKSWALPGLRIGWLVSKDTAVLEQVAALKDYTTICSSAPSEVLALMAVRATQDLTQRCRSIIAANADLADAFFKRWHHLFDWKRPAAGPICFPRVKATALAGASIDDWCERCVNECGVLLLPAGVYDHAASSAGGHFRLSLGRASCGSCLKVLDAWLEQKYGAPAP